MPIPRLVALLTAHGLTTFQPHLEPGEKDSWFDGHQLMTNDLKLFWGQRNHVSGRTVDEIRLVRNSDDPKENGKLVVLLCKHATNTDPRVIFGHPQTPGVDTFTRRYERSPKPTFDDLLVLLTNFLAHTPAV